MDVKVPANHFSAASEFGKRCTLLNVTCIGGNHDKKLQVNEIDNKKINFQRKNKYKFDEKLNIFSITVMLELIYKEKKETAFSVSSVFLLDYKLNTEPPPAELRDLFFGSFAELSGTHHCWPYWREYLDSMCRRMGLPSIISPLIVFIPEDPGSLEQSAKPKRRNVATKSQHSK